MLYLFVALSIYLFLFIYTTWINPDIVEEAQDQALLVFISAIFPVIPVAIVVVFCIIVLENLPTTLTRERRWWWEREDY